MAKVLYERRGRIARITLNRSPVLNAIDDDLPRELAAAVERADADDAVRCRVDRGRRCTGPFDGGGTWLRE